MPPHTRFKEENDVDECAPSHTHSSRPSRPAAGDLVSQLADARAELAALQTRYDALHADRARLAQDLEDNMRKYRRFKHWVFTESCKVAKDKDKDKDSSSSATPTIKMLETPITHQSACVWRGVLCCEGMLSLSSL